MSIVITGTGGALPANIVTNDDLSSIVETSDEWIQSRTGIQQRHFKSGDESTSSLATKAAQQALESANLTVDDIDLIIVGTATPDLTFPSVACQVQANLGMKHGAAFDLAAACSGFIYALSMAESQIQTGKAKRALVIGAETFSDLITPEDRTTYVLFGDGAGAVVIEKTNDESDTTSGIQAIEIFSNGEYIKDLYSSGGVASTGTAGSVIMNGREVFKHATKTLSSLVTYMLDKYNVDKDDIDWLIPHQANKRIIDATAKHLGMESSKVVLTVGEHANTSAASIPLALNVAVRDGRVKKGDLLFLEAFGAGFTWGAALIRF
tara:strand:- start:28633 stop:29598 length:966 start_codon:yes stop_codon:yes gene_type:complete